MTRILTTIVLMFGLCLAANADVWKWVDAFGKTHFVDTMKPIYTWVDDYGKLHYADKPEIITAHSSPVMIAVEGSPHIAAADAVTILEQIEGALAYLDTVGTRAEDVAYKRMRLVLTTAHRSLHNRMHHLGTYHDHTPVTDHAEHHRK